MMISSSCVMTWLVTGLTVVKKKSGLLLPSMEHGLDLVFEKTAQQVVSQYLCKWGVEHEMTKGHIKKGKEVA